MKKKSDGDDEAKRLAKENEELKKKNKELQNQLYGSVPKKGNPNPVLVDAAYNVCKDLGFTPKDHSQEAVDAAIDEIIRLCRTEKGMDKLIDSLERDGKTPETAFPNFDKFKENVEKQFPGMKACRLDMTEIMKELDDGHGPLVLKIMGPCPGNQEPRALGMVRICTKLEAQLLHQALRSVKSEEETLKAIQDFKDLQDSAREAMREAGIPTAFEEESEDELPEEESEDKPPEDGAPVPALQETPAANAEKCKVVLIPHRLVMGYMTSEEAAKNRHTREHVQHMIDIILGTVKLESEREGLRMKYLLTCLGKRRTDTLLDMFAKNDHLTHVAVVNENNERLCTIAVR